MSEPIRVLHIVTHMNRGGLETMIMNYYRHIDRSKIQFDFLTHRIGKKDYDDEIESLGGKIYHLPNLNPFSLSYRKALKTFFKEHTEYKIVHSHLDCMSAIPLKYAKKAGIQNRIAHAHSTSQDKNIKFLLKKVYMNFIPKFATKMFACGKEAGKWMFKGNDFQVLNNAIEAEKFQYDSSVSEIKKKELGLEGKFVLGHVGRFCEPKNHDFLIDVFYEVEKRDEDARLLLIGTGELMSQIQDKVTNLKLNDKVVFLGLRTDIPELLQAMDVFIFPSIYEGLPLSMIEAQSAGLSCVISDIISGEVIITNTVQTLSLNENVSKWANVIIELKNRKKAMTIEEIRKSGFDVKYNVHQLENIYLEMINYY